MPDFYLPEYDYYVEVKPNKENVQRDLDRAVYVMCSNRKTLLVLRDIPYDPNRGVFWFPIFFWHPVEKDIQGLSVTFLNEENKNVLYIASYATYYYISGDLNRYIWSDKGYETLKDIQDQKIDVEDTYHRDFMEYIRNAKDSPYGDLPQKCFRIARSARFEHGETP